MLDTKTAKVHDNIVFKNEGIDQSKWEYTPANQDTAVVLTFTGGLLATLVLGAMSSNIGGGTWLGVLCMFTVFGLGYLSIVHLTKHLARFRDARNRAYRKENEKILITGLEEQGWSLYEDSNGIESFVTNERLYLVNPDGVRYYSQKMVITDEEVYIPLILSDHTAQDRNAAIEKQQRTDFELNRYEEENGPMSPEMKAGFLIALERVL